MKMHLNSIFALLVLAVAATSCKKEEEPLPDHFSHVAIYYGCGFNNLSSGLKENVVGELAKGEIPGKNEAKALLAFCHNTGKEYDYEELNEPVLIRIYKDGGNAVLDTIKTYPLKTVSASAETLSSVLNEIKGTFKSDSYGLIFSSHASGWLPIHYKSPASETATASVMSIGSQYRSGGSSNAAEIDIMDFAGAIPYKMDYIILDCCLAGGIEVAWELRNVCDRIMFSPTEILSGGYDYKNLASRVFAQPADLKAACEDHLKKYTTATTTVVKCSEIQAVADAMTPILANHREEMVVLKNTTPANQTIQKYFYDTYYYIYFYDLRDAAVHLSASAEELAALDAALGKFVEFENHSASFLRGLRLTNVCGLSMYVPYKQWNTLNKYYEGLGWNKTVKVLGN